ncbi:MAG TPA: YtxH domain-containing protein [Chitinophagaceae bacterium]
MTTGTKVVLGILGAAAAGVVIGMLIAPEKGSDMRKRVQKTAGDWIDNLSNLFVKGKEELEDLSATAADKGRQARSAVEDKVNRMKESIS